MGRKIAWSTGLALALASCVLLPLLGHKLLTDWDEGIYAEVSREMLTRGWLVPHWNGRLWFEKPPLMLWITAVFFRVFGVTEFWARAGSALSGMAIAGVLHGWMARREGIPAAWIGTIALLSATGFLHVSRVGEMDALLSLGCVISLMGLASLHSEQASGWYGFWAGFAIAAMTKGSASAVLPLTVVALALVERWAWRQFGWAFWLGLAGFTMIVLPWHLAMWHLYGAAFTREYFGFHVLARATQAIEGHETPWWFYGKVLLVSAMPWVLLWPLAAWRAWRQTERRVWVVFVAVIVVSFGLVKTRLPHYVAPSYPAIAVVVAVYLASEMKRVWSMPVRQRAGVATIVAIVWIGGLMLTAGARKRLHSASGTGGWTAAQEREAIGLLSRAEESGPMLAWWTEPSRSLATCVFYSRRMVQRVDVKIDPTTPRKRYTSEVQSLAEAIGDRSAIILLETKLVTQMPDGFVYSRTKAGQTMEIGIVRRP